MPTVALNSIIQRSKKDHEPRPKELTSGVLLYNIRWFIRTRWLVASVILTVSFVGKVFYQPLQIFNIKIPSFSLLLVSGGLIVINIIYHILVKRFNAKTPDLSVKTNLWIQIVVDLIVVTVLVHIIGSTNTFFTFIYLFHVILACIFFTKVQSLIITLIAAGFYLIIVLLELMAVLPLSSAITASPITRTPHLDLIYVASAIFIWLVIWYLVSTVSESLRKREQQLHVANEQLKKADEEKTRKLLITTHDLKAPFTGIESNIQLLKIMYWDTVSQPVKDIINKIENRAYTLRERVNQILMLESLRSQRSSTEKLSAIDLQSVLTSVLEELEEKIKAKQIALNVHVPSTQIYGDIKQFKILFSNLLSNAVNYSYDEGIIDIRIEKLENTIVVYITDHGIGIKAEALPHIFEEYYRTSEAQEFNKSSTGLGMAIVKEIALKMGVNIEISSEQNKGTTTKVVISKKDETNRLIKNHNLRQSPGRLIHS